MPPAAPSNILIRDTIETDLPELLRIHVHPLVRLHELRLLPNDTVDGWRQNLFGGDAERGPWGFRSTTILREERIVGQITHNHGEADGKHCCNCGWSLNPEHWGQGIAVTAVSRLFGTLFDEDGADYITSSCFAGNERCIRLIRRLHYEPMGITLYDRLRTAIRTRTLRWVRRFMLSAERWRARSQGQATMENAQGDRMHG